MLVVDDNPGFATLIDRALENDGRFVVIASATDGAEGVALADKFQPDVVILDDRMPIMSGFQALPEVRRSAPNAKIVLFSAFVDASTFERATGLGADAVASKLDPIVGLLRTIVTLVREG